MKFFFEVTKSLRDVILVLSRGIVYLSLRATVFLEMNQSELDEEETKKFIYRIGQIEKLTRTVNYRLTNNLCPISIYTISSILWNLDKKFYR